MTDEQMAVYLGFSADPVGIRTVRALPEEKRALFERMATLEHEINLWTEGLGRKPSGVMIDLDRKDRK